MSQVVLRSEDSPTPHPHQRVTRTTLVAVVAGTSATEREEEKSLDVHRAQDETCVRSEQIQDQNVS